MRLFDESPATLARYQERWRYLHVDEYQDTNRPQYLWIRALAAKHRNLAVVGDDDQSIYGWRGADIRNILDFERDWPDATVIKLEQNYRSTQLILDAAHAVVSKNQARTDKKLWTEERPRPTDRPVRGVQRGGGGGVDRPPRRGADRGRAARRSPVARTTAATVKLRDIAILYRTNAQSRAIEEACLRYGIRYQVVGGTRFYSRREVKDALAYLRVLRSDADCGQLRAGHQRPGPRDRRQDDRGHPRVRGARGRALLARAGAGGRGRGPGARRRARAAIARVRGAGPARCGRASACCRCRSCSTTSSSARATGRCSPTAPRRARSAGRTCSSCARSRRATTTCRPEDALDRLLEETALVADQDSYESDADMLSLITLHAAKGLEFDVVFIAGLEEGALPDRPRGRGRGRLQPRPAADGGGAPPRLRGHDPGAAAALPVARLAARDAPRPGHVLDGRAVAVPARDPGRADERPAPRRAPGGRRAPARRPDDLNLVFGRGATRFGRPIRPGRRRLPRGERAPRRAARRARRSGRRGTSGPPRGVRRRRAVWDVRAPRRVERGTTTAPACGPARATTPAGRSRPRPRERRVVDRPVIPGERHYRDGDRVRHARWGDGIVVSSKLTRSDEEVTIAFRDPQIGRKTLLASLAGLELAG